MESFKRWFRMVAPTGWADAIVRSVTVAVVAFVVFQLQDLYESGAFDTSPNAVNALLVAGGLLAVNAVLVLVRP